MNIKILQKLSPGDKKFRQQPSEIRIIFNNNKKIATQIAQNSEYLLLMDLLS